MLKLPTITSRHHQEKTWNLKEILQIVSVKHCPIPKTHHSKKESIHQITLEQVF